MKKYTANEKLGILTKRVVKLQCDLDKIILDHSVILNDLMNEKDTDDDVKIKYYQSVNFAIDKLVDIRKLLTDY